MCKAGFLHDVGDGDIFHAAQSEHPRCSFDNEALRPTMIWGTGMPMLDRMVEVVKAGNWQWPDGGTHAMSTCHINNLVDALLLAVERGHGAYFVADAEEVTQEYSQRSARNTWRQGGRQVCLFRHGLDACRANGLLLESLQPERRAPRHAPDPPPERKPMHRHCQQG